VVEGANAGCAAVREVVRVAVRAEKGARPGAAGAGQGEAAGGGAGPRVVDGERRAGAGQAGARCGLRGRVSLPNGPVASS
jgi:hypothetical protein